MVKSWAIDFVVLYENEFAHKINWEQLKQDAMVSGHSDLHIEEERDGWIYRVSVHYWAKDYRPELYEIYFRKNNYKFVKTKKEYKTFHMRGEKVLGRTAYIGQHIKRGEWVYKSFDTKYNAFL